MRNHNRNAARRRRVLLLGLLLVSALATTTSGQPVRTHHVVAQDVDVIVRAQPGRAHDAVDAVRRIGGELRRPLPVIDGFTARVRADQVPALRRSPAVAAVTADGRVRLYGTTLPTPDYSTDFGTLRAIAKIVGAHDSYAAGFTGKGIDVALIDSGVAPVPGMTSGNVINGPDLSFESQRPELAYMDTFGHGTHMASIIAGRDVAQSDPKKYADPLLFNGIAPDARLVSVKVAAADGSTDVSQVIAAINWVVENRNKNGLNVRVLNLSFGTDSAQDPATDPLVYAAESAWKAGIVVVVAGGNDGSTTTTLANPAQSPNLLAVGADDPKQTWEVEDDVTPAFASRGTDKRFVDLVAPAVHVLGLRVPNSYVDQRFPSAVVEGRYFRGSGTSQGAAVVSGVAALLLQRYPTLAPDQVKSLLMLTAEATSAEKKYRGNGVPHARRAQMKPIPRVADSRTPWSSGLGSLEAARGSAHVNDGVSTLVGETDIFGKQWNPQKWTYDVKAGTTWNGGVWNGSTWTGSSWTGSSWTGSTWSGSTWTGSTWSGSTWTGSTWTGSTWTGDGWSGGSWSGSTWSGNSWTGRSWAGARWE